MQSNPEDLVTLVLGGVRSGKSRHAQTLAENFRRVTFIATARQRDDPEMAAKIMRHREEASHALDNNQGRASPAP